MTTTTINSPLTIHSLQEEQMKNQLLAARTVTNPGLRRTAVVLGFCAVVLGSLAVATPVHAATNDFVGTWHNIDAGTPHIVSIQITGADPALHVRVYGKCYALP